jgi:steroid 5-alpha reductase family enzyme
MFFELYLIGLGTIMAMMAVLWGLSLILKDSSIVDIFWGAGFVVSGWLFFVLTPDGFLTRKLIITTLVTIWGLRLSIYIGWRNIGKGEDYRYAKWREEAGSHWWWRSFFKVFFLQGIIMWVVSAPLLAAQIAPNPDRLTWLDYIGVVIWVVGFYFEAIGDWELARFKANVENKGKLLTSGLRRYTRHPNYFGDAAQWWGFYLIAVSAGGWWIFFSPLVMSIFLRFVSGVTLLQKNLKDTKPGYEEYMRRTNAFIPWFPRE